MEQPASYWIKELDLKPHPEDGFYREAYRSAGSIDADHLPQKYNGSRSIVQPYISYWKKDNFPHSIALLLMRFGIFTPVVLLKFL